MIQSFKNIVNPLNIIENYDSHENTSYYELISNMNTACDSRIKEMDIIYDIDDKNKCIDGGRTFAKSNKEYDDLETMVTTVGADKA